MNRDHEGLFNILSEAADPGAVSALERMVREASDADLNRINALAFAKHHQLPEDVAISALLHAARVGLFEMSWNLLCPGCGGVMDANSTLKTVTKSEYHCALCAAGHEPTLDDMVEVTFTVAPRVRRIAAHDPQHLAIWDYYRQMFWSSGMDLTQEIVDQAVHEIVIESVELPPGERAMLSFTLPQAFIIVFDPVTHTAQFLDVQGEPTTQRQELNIIFNKLRAPTGMVTVRPGPMRLALDNRTDARVLAGIFVAGPALNALMSRRRPFLTAKRLLCNQTFRDIYRTDTLTVDQRLKVTSLTFLFTDLKGSTELYDRVGDMVAYDLVRAHFDVLHDVVAAQSGAVVKTIGDAVMATFPTRDCGLAAALQMRAAMRALNASRDHEDLLLKIGIHEGPCLAVSLNDRQDYFGQTVNIAARVQGLADTSAIFATASIVENPQAERLLRDAQLPMQAQERSIRGVADALRVYEIP